MKRRATTAFAIASALALTAAASAQMTHHVPGNFPTIQQAIDASADGDTVLVGYGTNGVYNEAINFGSKSITVASAAGPAFTVINASSTGTSAVTIDGAAQATLEGFAIRNGSGTIIPFLTQVAVGGGVYVASGNVNIVNCVIESNSAQLGGGMYIGSGAVAHLEDCVIRNNSAATGGGLFSNAGGPTVVNTVIRQNLATSGAGAFIVGDATFIGTRVTKNTAANDGGGVIAVGGHTIIQACAFIGNSASQDAGGLFVTEHGSAEVAQCVFQANTANRGGAILVDPISDVAIAFTVFCSNESDDIFGPWSDEGGNSFIDLCPDSCYQHCGGQSPGGCWCDAMCQPFGDCCDDKCDHCTSCIAPDGGSCIGWCGAVPSGCWCDTVCFAFGDCCVDVCEACDYLPCQGGRGSCLGLCGNYLYHSDCGCGPACLDEGNCCEDACAVCGHCKLGDLNGDGVVDVSDLLILLADWGPCPRGGACPGDLNDDGAVDVSDLLILLANWG